MSFFDTVGVVKYEKLDINTVDRMMNSQLIKQGSLEGIFADYAFNKMSGNGLLPIPLPTGSGKSTAIFNFIYAVLKENLTQDKIILITSLKKNLQIDALKSVFEKNNDLELYNKKVLFIKSNFDCVMDFLPSLVKENKIPESIFELPIFTKLLSAVNFCNKNKNSQENQESVNEFGYIWDYLKVDSDSPSEIKAEAQRFLNVNFVRIIFLSFQFFLYNMCSFVNISTAHSYYYIAFFGNFYYFICYIFKPVYNNSIWQFFC